MTHVKKQVKHKSWATTTAYAIMCCNFLLYVFALDAVAVSYRDHLVMPTSEFYSSADDNILYQYPLMLVVLDVLVLVYIVVVAMIVTCMYKKGNFQPQEHQEGEGEDDAKKIAFYFFLILFGIAPLLCLASHAHYIAFAWTTDPVYSGAIGIYYGIIIFMQFFLLKQAYANSCRKQMVCQMCITWPTIIAFQVLITFFFVYIPIKNSIENTPTFLYAFISGTGVLLLLLIAYKVIHDPRGTLSISGTVQNILQKMEGKNIKLSNVKDWDNLDEEEKFTALIFTHYDIEQKCT